MDYTESLPSGQYEIDEFPRFGLGKFAKAFPKETRQVELSIPGNVEQSITVEHELRDLPRVDQTSDFHCVTTWTRRSLGWSGFRFADFYERIVVPRARPLRDATFVILRCQDEYVTSLPLGYPSRRRAACRQPGWEAVVHQTRRSTSLGGTGPLRI
jgi:DMSO/TMAO reductase YedYZ molybdopterin-dependent catalytic subunit